VSGRGSLLTIKVDGAQIVRDLVKQGKNDFIAAWHLRDVFVHVCVCMRERACVRACVLE
jgi:hypothetical protein